MPNVSNEFVANAQRLAEYATSQMEKDANIQATAEMVTDTLVQQKLVPASEKTAAVQSLLDHKQALLALNKTAQVKYAQLSNTPVASMGEPEVTTKKADVDYKGDQVRESDRLLLSRLGFSL